MRALTLTTALLLSIITLGQKPIGLEKFTEEMDLYNYEINSEKISSNKDIEIVILELKRVLELNGRTLESYDALIPDYNEFNSFNSEDIKNEMIAGFHVGFRYILGEYSIYMHASTNLDGDYSIGFMVEKTSEY
jgi:hypothetical protein